MKRGGSCSTRPISPPSTAKRISYCCAFPANCVVTVAGPLTYPMQTGPQRGGVTRRRFTCAGKKELKSRGFQLAAQVIDFPDGMLGDIGLYLIWG